MIQKLGDPPKSRSSRRRKRKSPEAIWVRGFLEFSGTENLTAVCTADLNGVSLTRAVEALSRGDCISSEKCDGPGTLCTFRHEGEDDLVEVDIFFEAGSVVLKIERARTVLEVSREPDAA